VAAAALVPSRRVELAEDDGEGSADAGQDEELEEEEGVATSSRGRLDVIGSRFADSEDVATEAPASGAVNHRCCWR